MRGSIKQRSKGSWRLRYEGPPDASGKRKQVSETVRGTKTEADSVLRDRLLSIEHGTYIPKVDETVHEFLARWLATYAASNTSLRTQQGYEGIIARYLQPAIGSVRLTALTPAHVQGTYAALLNKGLTPRTVLHAHRVLREALGHAVKWGLLSRNVADATSPPRARQKEIAVWDDVTVNAFLDAATESRFLDFFHLAILTGMRRSELAGLMWESVDLTGSRLSVVRTLQRIKGHGLVEGQPKTGKSRRSIALSPRATDLLHSIRGKQLEQRLTAQAAWTTSGYVFTNPDGTPINPDRTTHEFSAIVKRSGLPRASLHGLRHAHATLLLSSGTHPKVVSERLGHSSVGITLDTYSHVLPGLQEAAALALDARLSRTG